MPLLPEVNTPLPAAGCAPRRFATIVFADLDGTLLDAGTCRFDAALQALEILRSRAVPHVLCSSQTRRELAVYRERLGNRDPFGFEKGGGGCVPTGLFPFDIAGGFSRLRRDPFRQAVR